MIFPASGSRAAIVLFRGAAFSDSFSGGANVSFLVNRAGDIIGSAEFGSAAAALDLPDDDFIAGMWKSDISNTQTIYKDRRGKQFFIAYSKLPVYDAAVLTSVESDIIFEGIVSTTRRNIFLSLAVLSLAAILVFFFSKTISEPLKNLAAMARNIQDGAFHVNVESTRSDEIGLLQDNFSAMGRALEIFGNFTNMEIAKKALRGELTLGGTTKNATILFSDIRAFTAISETMHPQDVVEFLNAYFTRMVACVNKTGGTVDKFIGDAIMAHWGAATSSGNVAEDAFNCVRAALAMRCALAEHNSKTEGSDRPQLKIGCGINSGRVVSGQIGSDTHMEFTVIGDAVNLASRVEALNKPFGTDILITENTWRLIERYVVVEEMPPVKVKGKEKTVRTFAVINIKNDDGIMPAGPVSIEELSALLGTEAPDFNKVDTNAEEKKYKIGSD
jgi:adenylate cyclase